MIVQAIECAILNRKTKVLAKGGCIGDTRRTLNKVSLDQLKIFRGTKMGFREAYKLTRHGTKRIKGALNHNTRVRIIDAKKENIVRKGAVVMDGLDLPILRGFQFPSRISCSMRTKRYSIPRIKR